MKVFVFFSFLFSFFSCAFSQSLENDTTYVKYNQTKREFTSSEVYFSKPWNVYPTGHARYLTLYNTQDSSLFTGVIVSKNLNIPRYDGQFNKHYILRISDYKDGLPLPYTTRAYTYYQHGLAKGNMNSLQHAPIKIDSFYVAAKSYVDKDTISIRVDFDLNGDTTYCEYRKQVYNHIVDIDGYSYSKIVYERELSKSFHNNSDKLHHYHFRETYLPSEEKNRQEYSYSLSLEGDTTQYYTFVKGIKNGYSLSNLWIRNDTSFTPIRVIYKNDSLYDIISANFIFVNKKLKIWTKQQFIDDNNDKNGTTHFAHSLQSILINNQTYYILFPRGMNYEGSDEISQKSIDKIVKKYKKRLVKTHFTHTSP